MNLIIILLTALVFNTAETPEDWAKDKAWLNMTDEQRYTAPVEYKARDALDHLDRVTCYRDWEV